MRWVLGTVGVLAALYAGAWFVGERQIESRAAAALDGLREQGWTVDYAALNTTGFPSRFDTTVTDLRLADPEGTVGWEAPFVQVFALAYRPNRVIAVWPHEQTVTVGGRAFAVTSESLRASAAAGLSSALPFREAIVEGEAVGVGDGGPALELERVLAAVRDDGAPGTGSGGGSYDVHLDAQGLALGGRALLDRVDLDGKVALDRAVALRAEAGAPPPRLVGLDLTGLRLSRGDQALELAGSLAPDDQGYAAGTLTLVAENWRGLLGLAEQVGLLDSGRRALFERALEPLAAGGDRIEVPVTFEGGRVTALGLPLLEAPRLLP